MRRFTTTTMTLLVVASAVPAAAQPAQKGMMSEMTTAVKELEDKLVALAKALPDKAFEWRPATGVRSSGEVLLHVAADNYLIPGALGFQVPVETGIKGNDYSTAQAYEQRKLNRQQTMVELERSFAWLRQQMEATTDRDMEKQITMFGSAMPMRRGWLLATNHLHEHLGQLIAYARTNGVVPPWSR
ncbi:MAG: DinB family protein [Gemmatimonadota bacterium]